MGDNNPCKRYMAGLPEGRRPVGRPRLRWRDVVTNDVRSLGEDDAENWQDIAQDRRRWRHLVEAAKDRRGLLPRE